MFPGWWSCTLVVKVQMEADTSSGNGDTSTAHPPFSESAFAVNDESDAGDGGGGGETLPAPSSTSALDALTFPPTTAVASAAGAHGDGWHSDGVPAATLSRPRVPSTTAAPAPPASTQPVFSQSPVPPSSIGVASTTPGATTNAAATGSGQLNMTGLGVNGHWQQWKESAQSAPTTAAAQSSPGATAAIDVSVLKRLAASTQEGSYAGFADSTANLTAAQLKEVALLAESNGDWRPARVRVASMEDTQKAAERSLAEFRAQVCLDKSTGALTTDQSCRNFAVAPQHTTSAA